MSLRLPGREPSASHAVGSPGGAGCGRAVAGPGGSAEPGRHPATCRGETRHGRRSAHGLSGHAARDLQGARDFHHAQLPAQAGHHSRARPGCAGESQRDRRRHERQPGVRRRQGDGGHRVRLVVRQGASGRGHAHRVHAGRAGAPGSASARSVPVTQPGAGAVRALHRGTLALAARGHPAVGVGRLRRLPGLPRRRAATLRPSARARRRWRRKDRRDGGIAQDLASRRCGRGRPHAGRHEHDRDGNPDLHRRKTDPRVRPFHARHRRREPAHGAGRDPRHHSQSLVVAQDVVAHRRNRQRRRGF